MTGPRVAFFEDWLAAHRAGGREWWEPIDHGAALARVAAPVHLIGGWYDLFLPRHFAQYRALRDAGRAPRLSSDRGRTATSADGYGEFFGPALEFLRATIGRGGALAERAGAPLPDGRATSGATSRDWPPPGAREERWHLQPGGALAPAAPAAIGARPLPLRPGRSDADGRRDALGAAGRSDNRALEARADVLVYTSAPLERDVEAIGPVRAELFVRSSLAHTDFFVRLCDVDPAGASNNVCDGILRLAAGAPGATRTACRRIGIALWPTAHRFRRGHRIRVQVSSGAHPRFARNPGTGEPLATATTLVAADQEVFHDPGRPSALVVTAL